MADYAENFNIDCCISVYCTTLVAQTIASRVAGVNCPVAAAPRIICKFVMSQNLSVWTERRGYRNGFKPRQLKTRIGTLELMIPQDREGTFQTELFERYQRSEKALVSASMQMYVEAVSTRKAKAEELCGTSFSKSTVSRLVVSLDDELEAWRKKRLEMAIPYLLVDARYEKVRVNGRIPSMGVLVVKGIRADGLREILTVSMADTENETSYDELFKSLKHRGLHGVQLE